MTTMHEAPEDGGGPKQIDQGQETVGRVDCIPRPAVETGLLPAALWYAEHDYSVIPLEPAGKRPIITDWPRRASRDSRQITEWWQWNRAANLGVVTGATNRLLVIDVDMKHGIDGIANWKAWAAEHWLDLQACPRVQTPSGGYHFWFRTDAPVRNATNLHDIPGVDVRGDGGQVAVPPSVRALTIQEHGYDPARVYVEYKLLHGRLDLLPEASDVLLAAVERGGVGLSSGHQSPSPGANGEFPATEWFIENGFRPGQRNADCHRLACRLWRNHWPYGDLVTSRIYEAWLKTPQHPDPFPWSEAMGCIRSARQYVVPKVAAEMAWVREFGGAR